MSSRSSRRQTPRETGSRRRSRSPPRSFAPGLARSARKSSREEQSSEDFKFLRRQGQVATTWSTQDPVTGEYSWAGSGIQENDSFTVSEEQWACTTLEPGVNNHAILPDGREIDSRVIPSFLRDDELMKAENEDCHQSEFKQRNPGLPISSTSEGIIMHFGEEVTTTLQPTFDRRLAQVSREGNGIYADGSRGMVKKRHYDEYVSRANTRDDEMAKATTLLQLWNSLSELEKTSRRNLQRNNRRLDTLRLETEERAPEAYDQELFVNDSDIDDDSGNAFEVQSSELTVQNSLPIRTPSTDWHGSQRYEQSVRSSGRSSVYPDRRRLGSHIDSRHTTSRRSKSIPEFNTQPPMVPPDDIEDEAEIDYISEGVELKNLIELCENLGRIVVVSLAPEVHFSSTAILDRVFGGLQEIQFFQNERLAILVYISPLDAQSFLDHVKFCRKYSQQDFRRLQVDAEFYGKSNESASCEAQAALFSQIVIKKASRTLKIGKIGKMRHAELFDALKVQLPDLYLVRMKLVIPKKRYEKDVAFSNIAILEFASVKEAFEARQKFMQGIVEGFKNCTAEFFADIVGRSPPCSRSFDVDLSTPMPVATIQKTGSEYGKAIRKIRAGAEEDFDQATAAIKPSEFEERRGNYLHREG